VALLARSDLRAKLSAYQRDLMRHMFVPLSIFVLFAVALLAAGFMLQSRWQSRYFGWGAVAAIFVAAQLTLARFRRNVALLSKVHELTCPGCGAALGLRYATLKRTGRCGTCGAEIASEA
jgi:hypothetical protein